jgi:hypothetical protein
VCGQLLLRLSGRLLLPLLLLLLVLVMVVVVPVPGLELQDALPGALQRPIIDVLEHQHHVRAHKVPAML